ncbi:TetR/AcrR family transcriptional regulator [Sedimentitalea sp. XS_ASV28]|uniref:TetR/AcrR family transcriptional regulator n=1 Tax=Sedimentitalea sp. XS_ASV28 TaxID=3241296 RepID=UPI003512FD65
MAISETRRQRAPSERAIRTRERIFDAAETVFADKGFDAATLRDIAALAGTQVGLVHHHGGGKAELFCQTVKRRADDLSTERIDRLTARKSAGPMTVEDLLGCFVGPYLDRAASGDVQWLAYARLVAIASADSRWRDLAAECFDPTANRFIDEFASLFPDARRPAIASGFVYSVSAMLALLTSSWRIETLGATGTIGADHQDELVRFCAAGIRAILQHC